MNYSNSQRAGVILNFTAVLFGGYENRKNQQNILDLLHQKPKWAGGFVPEVYVKNMTFSGKEVDVIIIKQSDNTPFYLLEDYKKNNTSLFKGVVYTSTNIFN